MMNHLACVSGGIEDTTIARVLKTNHLLEAFGNAKVKQPFDI